MAVRRRVLEELLPGMNVAVAKSFFACLDVVRYRWFPDDEGALAKIDELIDATKSRIREAGGERAAARAARAAAREAPMVGSYLERPTAGGADGGGRGRMGVVRGVAAGEEEGGGGEEEEGGGGRGEAGGERKRVGVDAPQSAASGGRQCQMPGCSKSAKHNPATRKTEFCKAHGGGPRCQMPGCSTSAQRNPATRRPSSAKLTEGVRDAKCPGARRVPSATRQRRRPSSAKLTEVVRGAKCPGA